MPYFECDGCGQLINLTTFDASELREHCPVCEATTTWRIAFESEEGASF